VAELQGGSWLITVQKPGHREARVPVALDHGEQRELFVRTFPEASIGESFVFVPGGPVLLGGDRDAEHALVELAVEVADLAIGRFPVTFGEYLEFLNELARRSPEEAQGRAPQDEGGLLVTRDREGCFVPGPRRIGDQTLSLSLPALGVSWEDAVAYCDWLTQYERADKLIGETERYRLPTDREWSWAVGLGDELGKTPQEKSGKVANVFPWGKEWPPPRAAGNFGVIPRGIDDGYTQTSPVEKFRVNALGLYDTAGNVWIWCEDWYNGEKQRRVLRGGSWLNHKEAHLRSSSRNSAAPNYRDYGIGFRVVLIQEEN
jgi:formylglycine-generating enzyme required for sulfatase activity